MIEKVKWAKGADTAFDMWFHQQLTNTLGNRSALEKDWQDRLVQWRAKLPTNEKEFPWVGASNLVFPLTDMHATPVYADFMTTLHAPEDYWNIAAKRPDRVAHATPLREALTAVEGAFLKMRRVNKRALMDQNILGTAIYKVHWVFDRKLVKDYNAAGQIEPRLKIRSEPAIDHIPIQDFIIPAEAWAIDPDEQGGATWVAQRFYLTEQQLKERAESESEFLPPYDKDEVDRVINWVHDEVEVVNEKIRAEDNNKPWANKKIELYEIHVRFDASDKDIDDDLVIIWHQPTMSKLRSIYNPYLHGKRPFYKTEYLPGFGFYGLGIAEIDEWAQLTSTKLLNAMIDNIMVGNTIMIDAPEGTNIVPGEAIYPGKVWLRPPGDEVRGLKLGEINPSIMQVHGMLLQWSEMRTAVSEIRQGNMSGLPSRTPATSLLSMLREGNKRFDMIMSNFRDVHGEMGLRIIQNISQFMRENPLQWRLFFETTIGMEDAAKVMEVLATPIGDIENAFGVTISATSAQTNKEAEKQSFVGLLQILTQIYGQLVQTSMFLLQTPPGSPPYETASAAYAGGVELIQRLLERFDIQNPSQYLGNMAAIAGALAAQQQGMNPAASALAPPPLSPYPASAPPSSPYLGF